jgi:hypothetical protein
VSPPLPLSRDIQQKVLHGVQMIGRQCSDAGRVQHEQGRNLSQVAPLVPDGSRGAGEGRDSLQAGSPHAVVLGLPPVTADLDNGSERAGDRVGHLSLPFPSN